MNERRKRKQEGGLHRGTATTTTTTGTGTTTSTSIAGRCPDSVQIVAMSATLDPVTTQKLGVWLDAAVYGSSERPVPLERYLKIRTEMYGIRTNEEKQQELIKVGQVPTPLVAGDNATHIGTLANETITQGHSVLIFCGTKARTKVEAKRLTNILHISDDAPAIVGAMAEDDGGQQPQPPQSLSPRETIAQKLTQDNDLVLNQELANLVRRGIAFHNADLSAHARRWIEAGFQCGAIRILCATSTLAAGVNLPARRVIFLDAYKGKDSKLTPSEYHQMAGRAGRAGIDDRGEAVLVYQPQLGDKVPLEYLKMLMTSVPGSINTHLLGV